MKARLIYDEGNPRVLPTPTGYLIDCTVESPPPDVGRGVWIEMTRGEARDLHDRLGWQLWEETRDTHRVE